MLDGSFEETAPCDWRRGDFLISTDRTRLDFAVLHGFLTTSYWSPGITRDLVERAARNSLPFGLYHAPLGETPAQIGYARLLTDGVSLAYLADVFVLEAWRGRGLSRWLMTTLLAHPAAASVRAWLLRTRDAHGLYAKFGFTALPEPERYMTRPGNPGWLVTSVLELNPD
jgi:ribosomal protein S18 acetylase RimI-like enzyme